MGMDHDDDDPNANGWIMYFIFLKDSGIPGGDIDFDVGEALAQSNNDGYGDDDTISDIVSDTTFDKEKVPFF